MHKLEILFRLELANEMIFGIESRKETSDMSFSNGSPTGGRVLIASP
ncbi:MAG: hypothetical protein ACRD8Z_12815 [Nitrososphaeraceae archaeon]